MSVKNYMEILVEDLLPEVLEAYPKVCKCEQCIDDIKAWSLNHLKPAYSGTDLGDTYIRLKLSDLKMHTQIVKTIAQAIELVSKNPHHQHTCPKNP